MPWTLIKDEKLAGYGEVAYPPVGILYARDSLEAALQSVKEYKGGEIPTASSGKPTTGATDIGYSTIVGCASLKLVKKLSYEVRPEGWGLSNGQRLS